MLTHFFFSVTIITSFILFFGIKLLKKSISKLYYFYWIIFGIYISGVVAFTLFPFPFEENIIQIMIEDNLGLSHNFIPFNGIKEIIEFSPFTIALKQLVGNILLFVPLGFALPILYPKLNLKSINIVIICFFVSLTIELTQLVSGVFIGYNYRSFDVDDLLLNTIGSIIGLLLFKLFSKFLRYSKLI